MSESFEDSQQINAPQTSQYNWLGVLKFLQDQYKEQNFKETEQMLEKQQLQEKISQIEADLKGQENINKDLIKRIKMLEFALRQERIRYTKLLQGQNISQDVIKSVMQDENTANILKQNQSVPQVPQRKAKQHRPLLLKILEEVGLDDIFDEENELDKANQNLKVQDLKFQQKDQTVLLKENDLSSFQASNAVDSSFIDLSKSTSQPNNQNNLNAAQQEQQQLQQQSQLEKSNSGQQIPNTVRNNLQSQLENVNNNKQFDKMDETIESYKSNRQNIVQLKCQLKSHLDGVRDTFFAGNNILVTVSEDCMIKLWDTTFFFQANADTQIDPYYTLREHTGCLYTVTGFSQEICSDQNYQTVFASGSEGLIKAWSIQSSDKVDTFGTTENKNYSSGSWQVSEEPVWQIIAHPFEKKLLSASADGKIHMWSISEEYGKTYEGKMLQQYIYKPQGDKLDIPTSCAFVYSNLNFIAASYANSNSLVLFDKESAKAQNVIKYQSDLQIDQIYRFVAHPQLRMLVSGHEDSYIRFFDINQNKPVYSLKGHNDTVTGISFHQDKNYLSTVGHDGFIKTWDLRQYKCLNEIKAHQSKYDEAIHSVNCSQTSDYIATSGADGVVNIYQTNV
ncbi:hypothetical protein ABPG72_022057 [Tetrahymena utriculariae]